VNTKTLFVFVIGLIVGLACGYIATDLHYRSLERAKPAPAGPTAAMESGAAPMQGQMPEIHNRINVLEDLLAKEPGNLGATVELGNMYYDSGQFSKAISFYRKALELNPSQPDVMADLGTCYRETGDPAQAVGLYEKAFALDKGHWKSVLNALVVSLRDLKDKKRAQRYYDLLETLHPPDVDLKALQADIRKLP